MLQTYKNFNPVVSVIMATYNRAAYLPRSIVSVLKQTYKSWELIVIDDGGTDTTFQVVNAYVSKDYRIRYVKKENAGPACARNLGVTISCGTYLSFLDSDDEYKEDHLQLRVAYMAHHPATDLIHGGLEIIGDPFVTDWYDHAKKIHLNECHVEGTFFGKREYFTHNGFNDIKFGEGLDLIERTKHTYVIERVHWPTYIYHRDTPGSITNTI